MKIEKSIKKKLIETKKHKDQLLIEEKIVESRLMMIVGSENNIKNFDKLPKREKNRIALQVFEEVSYFSEQKLLNENLETFLNKIFGTALPSMVETLVEPMINRILGKIGLTGFFKNFIISFLTSNPREFIEGLKDCRVMTKLIAASLAEAVVMNLQEKKGYSGQFANFLRNTLGGMLRDSVFAEKIEGFIGDIVCSGLEKITGNAESLYNKIKNFGLGLGSTGL